MKEKMCVLENEFYLWSNFPQSMDLFPLTFLLFTTLQNISLFSEFLTSFWYSSSIFYLSHTLQWMHFTTAFIIQKEGWFSPKPRWAMKSWRGNCPTFYCGWLFQFLKQFLILVAFLFNQECDNLTDQPITWLILN